MALRKLSGTEDQTLGNRMQSMQSLFPLSCLSDAQNSTIYSHTLGEECSGVTEIILSLQAERLALEREVDICHRRRREMPMPKLILNSILAKVSKKMTLGVRLV